MTVAAAVMALVAVSVGDVVSVAVAVYVIGGVMVAVVVAGKATLNCHAGREPQGNC